MTAVLDTTEDATATDTASEQPLASWAARAGAFAVDVLLGLAVIAPLALGAVAAPLRGWLWWVFVGVAAATVLVMAVNRLMLPTITGFSLGRALFGIAVRRPDGSTVGVWRLLARDLAHLLDTAALFIGWFWPLWDRRRRTFADLLLRTEVQSVQRPQRDVRRLTAVALIAGMVMSTAAAGLSYLVVFRQEQAIDAARAEITEQGPGIVEQILSYKKDSLQQDFSNAQSLTTEAYRPQLIAQQQIVQEGGATSNEYFAVSTAVLPDPPVTTDKAAMLVAMQGQRGEDPKDLKFTSATLRVDFEKTDGQWRVANLTVLKKPLMNMPGQ